MSSVNNKQQEYLAEAYRIAYYQQDSNYVSTSAIAEEMGVSAPAVTRMVQRLRDAGLVDHEPYRGIVLTSEGEREALHNIRKHRIVERFLVDVMRFEWHEVHDAADDLGGAVTDTVVNRMADMMGHPTRCPHGEPIPNSKLIMPRVVDEQLQDVPVGNEYLISRVHTHDDKMLTYLASLGLQPGVAFVLSERAPFNGPIKLMINNADQFIGHEMAGVLHVCNRADFDLSFN